MYQFYYFCAVNIIVSLRLIYIYYLDMIDLIHNLLTIEKDICITLPMLFFLKVIKISYIFKNFFYQIKY